MSERKTEVENIFLSMGSVTVGLLSLTTLLLSVGVSFGEDTCEWDVDVDNDTLTLNLEALESLTEPIKCALDGSGIPFDFTSQFELVYTPCKNGVNCSIPNKNIHNATMVSQYFNKSLPSCAAYLAVWDSGTPQPIYVENKITKKQQYIFEYKNGLKELHGNCTQGRYLNVMC